jgi:hypothetical protein
MKIEADGFSIDFTDAIDAFIFDEKDKSRKTYHGLPMKAVDIVAEFNDAYVFLEMKDYNDPAFCCIVPEDSVEEMEKKRAHFKWLKNYLKYKYRDSYLFRHAESKVDKPIHYICLLTFDNALNSAIQKSLQKELPVGKASKRWKQALVKSCHVVNIEKWKKNFVKWPICQTVASGGA